ncbi:uncharacterized protein RCC_00128 [Ramularia collo-cygni]|uniref:Uncharacterized protein n=1 Tax=Ramularia collo-cygni TaxID=112498 RepID=A0A2D3UNR4_9PEZI|nr:uncharacterized protein RCC_00128 [Ramularia collo-cygni]CZT14155.1 uncharacterized protein RCC_00128 [Ramularia collo-cygni]
MTGQAFQSRSEIHVLKPIEAALPKSHSQREHGDEWPPHVLGNGKAHLHFFNTRTEVYTT